MMNPLHALNSPNGSLLSLLITLILLALLYREMIKTFRNLIREAGSAGDYCPITREQINEFLKTPSYHVNGRQMTKAQQYRAIKDI